MQNRLIFVQMLTACFDGGAKESNQYNVLSVAGFASFATVWKEFADRWTQRLCRDSLPYFHAGDFAHSTGAFKHGWKHDERRRKSLLTDLMDIIHSCGLRKFGHVIRIDDYKGVLKKHNPGSDIPAWPMLDAFTICATNCIDKLYSYAKSEGINKNLRYIFEKGDPEDMLRHICRARRLQDPDFQWGKPYTDSKGVEHDPFVGLQAAGWIAYEYYLDADRLLFGQPSERWALQQFESLPGHVIVLHHKELLPDIPRLHALMQEKCENVRDAAFWLESVRSRADIPPSTFTEFQSEIRSAFANPGLQTALRHRREKIKTKRTRNSGNKRK